MLGFRVPTTSVGAKGEGVKGDKSYCILGFRVPPTSVRAKGSEGGEGEQRE